jgi:hypothetical protein
MASCAVKSVSPLAEPPSFAKDYPDDPALGALVESFERGNYRAVRDGAAKLQGSDASDAVKDAARDLRSRTEPSRFQLALLAIAALLVLVLSTYEIVMHGKGAR